MEIHMPSIDEVAEWCPNHDMAMNARKLLVLNIYTDHLQLHVIPATYLNNKSVSTSENIKYLGITIDHHLSFTDYVEKIGSQVRPLVYVMLNLKRSDLLCRFCITCIRPKVTYDGVA